MRQRKYKRLQKTRTEINFLIKENRSLEGPYHQRIRIDSGKTWVSLIYLELQLQFMDLRWYLTHLDEGI